MDPKPARPAYDGPRTLADALSKLHLERGEEARFHREGLRADSEYRDLGFPAATGGRLGIKHIRVVIRFEDAEGDVTVNAGDSLSQPAGMPHNVIARSPDLELLALNLPAEYGTFER